MRSMSRFVTVGLVLMLVAPMSGCGGSAGAPTTVESGRFVTPEVGAVISPSPDGRHLLVGDEDRLCLQSIDEGGVNCTEWAGGSNPRDLDTRWTPDSSKVVLLDRRASAMGADHSIWLLDTSDMSLASWAAFGSREEGYAYAVAVAPSGDSVAFEGAVGEDTGVFLIEEPGEIRHLVDARFGHSVVWDPGGSSIFYAGIREGVSRAMVDGGAPVLITESGDLGSMILADVSRDGSTILVLLIDVARTFIKGEAYFALLSAKDGTVTPLKENGWRTPISRGPIAMGPTGWPSVRSMAGKSRSSAPTSKPISGLRRMGGCPCSTTWGGRYGRRETA